MGKFKHERMLRVDKNFVPVSADDGDEFYPNGIFVFNITKMLEFIKNNPTQFQPECIAVKDYSTAFSSINESHLDTICHFPPIILAEISPGRYNVIDGNHRLEKARRSGMETIMAYKLGPKQHMPFLTTQKAHVIYVEFWNGKLKGLEKYSPPVAVLSTGLRSGPLPQL
jgi:hypothetical protein